MAKGSRLAGVADGLVPRRRAGMPDVITCTSEGDDPSGRGRQGVNRPDDAPAGPAHGCELGATTRETHALAVAGNPCASRMIPLESPVPEIGTPGSESGGRKRAHGNRPAARLRKRRTGHRLPTGYAPPLDSTRMLSVPSDGRPLRLGRRRRGRGRRPVLRQRRRGHFPKRASVIEAGPRNLRPNATAGPRHARLRFTVYPRASHITRTLAANSATSTSIAPVRSSRSA